MARFADIPARPVEALKQPSKAKQRLTLYSGTPAVLRMLPTERNCGNLFNLSREYQDELNFLIPAIEDSVRVLDSPN